MPTNAIELKKLIEREIAGIRDRRITEYIRRLLVEPSITMRDWDYRSPGDTYPCWTVLDDGDGGIAYCEHGFGPRRPWGLVFTGGNADLSTWMGADSGWFPTFLEAFFESQTATPLPIWQVFKIDVDPWDAVTGELEWGAAWERYEALCSANPDRRYLVHQPLNP